jgi:hypothetical protein
VSSSHQRLTEECYWCKEPLLHLKAILDKQTIGNELSIVADGKPVSNLEIDCKHCQNTRLLLTDEGRQMVQALKPMLSDVDKISAKIIAKAEKASKQASAGVQVEAKKS